MTGRNAVILTVVLLALSMVIWFVALTPPSQPIVTNTDSADSLPRTGSGPETPSGPAK